VQGVTGRAEPRGYGGFMNTKDLKDLDSKIQSMKKTAEELKQMGEDFPALYRNVSRLLASIKMLELNVSDLSRM
jgi:hypothetical protein